MEKDICGSGWILMHPISFPLIVVEPNKFKGSRNYYRKKGEFKSFQQIVH